MRLLILGGTTEATALATLLAAGGRHEATFSLAGRTVAPRSQPLPTRIGGFGGVEGMVQWLKAEKTEAVVDATHPYADQISAHAVAACRQAGIPLASLVRLAWQCTPGDKWQDVASTEAAVQVLGPASRRVFVTVGRQELHLFAAAPQHRYVARLIEAPDKELPPDLTLIKARGPFDPVAERTLMRDNGIEIVVSKNSGGDATYAKIEAARDLGLPVIMIARPDKPAGHVVASPEAALHWLDHDAPRSLRGV